METGFYISNTKIEGGYRITAQELERLLQFFGSSAQTQLQTQTQVQAQTLSGYIKSYIEEVQTGKRLTGKGTRFCKGTVASIKQSMKKFMEYQQQRGIELNFGEVDLGVYRDYNAFLIGENYSVNSVGKCIKNLKQVLKAAEEDGFAISAAVKGKAFKVHTATTDAIYLTMDDLHALEAVDLTALPKCYSAARNIFMIGVWTAQRVSDYNYLGWENVSPDNSSIRLIQKKTGKKVIIPCNTPLRRILQQYRAEGLPLPHLYDQKINDLMKEIGRMAGLCEPVEMTSSKGGIGTTRLVPKWQLIQTHTARRTGATLMYLSGMDVYDICKITGHSSIQTLERYIKASELETVKKMSREYEFFR